MTFLQCFVICFGLMGRVRCDESYNIETLLDKINKTELKVGNIDKQMTETITVVQTALEELKREQEKFHKDMNDFEVLKREYERQRISDFEQMLDAFQNQTSTIHLQFEDLKKQVKVDIDSINKTLTMRTSRPTSTVLFKARELSDVHIHMDKNLIFIDTILNYGGGYDRSTGKFTAPVKGMYMFSFQLCLSGGHRIRFGIFFNHELHSVGQFFDNTVDACYTANDMMILEVGDEVSIKSLYSTVTILMFVTRETYNYWNTFSGMLVHE